MIINILKRYSHINWALADQVMVSGINFLTGILVARFLGIEDYGRFTLIWIVVLFASSIQVSTINSPMMSIGPKQTDENSSAYFGAVIAQQLIFASISAIIIVVGIKTAALFFPEWYIDHLVLPLAAVTFFYQTQDFTRRLFFVQERQVAAFVNDVISYCGQLLLLIYLFFMELLTVENVLWSIAVTSAIATVVGIVVYGKVSFNYVVFVSSVRRHWGSAKWLTGSALLQWTSGNMFIIAAGSILGPTAVGALKAGQNIMGVVHILFQGLENIVPVRASFYLHKSGFQSMAHYLRKVTVWGGLATGILAVAVSVSPEFLLTKIFGDDYQGYGYILIWYAVIYVVSFLSLPLRILLRTIEKTFPVFLAYILMTIFSVLTAVPMVQEFGLQGVLIGMLILVIISASTLYVFAKYKYGFSMITNNEFSKEPL